MDANTVYQKVQGLKNLALFYTGAEFLTMGALTDRFDAMVRDFPHLLVGVYTRRASVADIEEDMAWTLSQSGEVVP